MHMHVPVCVSARVCARMRASMYVHAHVHTITDLHPKSAAEHHENVQKEPENDTLEKI